MIRVTEGNLEELSKQVDVLEVLDEGVKILTSKNGIVMQESIAKWDDVVVLKERGVIEIVGNIAEQAKKVDELAVESMPEALVASVEKVTKKVKATKTKKA